MKFDALAAIAHNLADSLGSGGSDLFRFWSQHVFDAVANDPKLRLEVDFLAGEITAGVASEPLLRVVNLAPSVLANLCRKHSTEPSAFKRLLACYTFADDQQQFAVTVEDQLGRCRTDTYRGSPGKRVRQ